MRFSVKYLATWSNSLGLLLLVVPAWVSALDFRGSVENQSQISWKNSHSAFNPDDERFDLPIYNNLTRFRAILDDDIWRGQGLANNGISFYLKVFGELETAPIKPLEVEPVYSSFRFDEVYLDWEMDDRLYVLVGKKRLSWGVGFFMNPVDAINPLRDVKDPINSIEGSHMLKVEYFFGEHSISAIYSPEFTSNATLKRHRFAGTLSLFLEGYELKLHGLGGEELYTMLGASLRKNISDYVVYAEYAGRSGSDKLYPDQSGAVTKRDQWQNSALLGLTYSFLGTSFLSVEYIYNQSGYSSQELQYYYRAIEKPQPEWDEFTLSLIDQGRLNLSKHYLGVSFGIREYRELWDFEIRALATLDGLSCMFIPLVQYHLSDSFTTRLEYLVAFGQDDSEYSQFLFRHRIHAYLILSF